jgi:hypothetical protein
MKPLLFLIIVAALALLWFDDNTKRTDLLKAEARADAAQQQTQAETMLVQQLTTERNQLQTQLIRLGNVPPPPAPVPVPVAAATALPTPVPTPTPTWFQQRLNGSSSVLDRAPPAGQ